MDNSSVCSIIHGHMHMINLTKPPPPTHPSFTVVQCAGEEEGEGEGEGEAENEARLYCIVVSSAMETIEVGNKTNFVVAPSLERSSHMYWTTTSQRLFWSAHEC